MFKKPNLQAVDGLLLLFVAALLIRLITLGLYPMGSTTEPRYAEMARKMLETGNWITPMIDYGVPFWGKPPLSFWASALTMAIGGINEFGARLAPFLATMGIMGLLWAWSPHKRLALAASFVMLTCIAGFLAAGAVMTDMFMVFATTMCMVAFWRSLHRSAGPWPWLFFVGIGIGLLAKGPVATVVTGISIGTWVLLRGEWRRTWAALPWIKGSLLATLIALPWYALAEWKTPGFLQYFIVGEHFNRFLIQGWTGDKYGNAHTEPLGTIFWFALQSYTPWVWLLPPALYLQWRQSQHCKEEEPAAPASLTSTMTGSGEHLYLLCWALGVLVFFAFARNIVPAYVLPGLPAFALLTAQALLQLAKPYPRSQWVWALGLLIPVGFCLGLVFMNADFQSRSEKELLKSWQGDQPLVCIGFRSFSTSFYSQGRAQLVTQPADIQAWLTTKQAATLLMSVDQYQRLNPTQLSQWHIAARGLDSVLLQKNLP